MLLLILEAGTQRFGLTASRIVEVIPAPALRPMPGLPAFIAGAFSYHGRIFPVIDLSSLLTGRPARPLLSTRIVMLNFQPPQGSEPLLLGLLAEHATELLSCAPEEFQPAGVHGIDTPFAGEVLIRPDGLIQELNVDRMLSEKLQEQLLGAPV
jgi:chemotaxis-related protein WspB